ncbi:glucosamine-6-phosphate deaminase [Sphaerochaeta globosa]|uniref:Glucosamine-6-phosphate deaminase n=1 Tax=Sphaerochaeta globosa (strain ATCC BAA-1886 / DSM 22777 / Buddy) TaxID=158189 RepID=F0RTZ2_SPHGB|nr:glucosamine-6-phosphate deaminase [Sphaerochaeta globosa]ADY14070.1 Glucosamine-6-phosphate deaminase [Sphaerochaeta globosa str. Buddy]
MRVIMCEDKHEMGYQAAQLGISLIKEAIERKGQAVIVVATGLSQFSLYAHLGEANLDWSKVEAFGLNEYVNLPDTHPSSFRYYLKTRFVKKVQHLGAFYAVNGDAQDLQAEIERLNALIREKDVDVAFLGIGENGHIGFNDPPANFETNAPYIVVELEERCRRQQVSEGWFATLEEVPRQAVTMSVRQILKAKNLVCSVPDQRKARAVAMCLYDQISVYAPCTVLRTKKECTLLLDRPSSLLVMGDRR